MTTTATPARFRTEADFVESHPNSFGDRERRLAQAILENKNISDTFQQALVVSANNGVDGTLYLGAAGETVALNSGKAVYELYNAATASAPTAAENVITPYQSADGLELKPVAAADALELTNGTTALSRAAFTVGTDPAFFCEATIKIDDISDVTELFYGFREAMAYGADPDDYDEMAAFNVGLDADGQIEIHTIVGDAATVEVDTTLTDWVDDVAGTGEHTLRIEVARDGSCKFLFDGSVPTVTAAYTFVAGTVVIPFLHLNTETGDPGVSISSWKVGRL